MAFAGLSRTADMCLKSEAKVCDRFQHTNYPFTITVTNLSIQLLPLGWNILHLIYIEGALKYLSGSVENTGTMSSSLRRMSTWSNRPLSATDICCTSTASELNWYVHFKMNLASWTLHCHFSALNIHVWHQPVFFFKSKIFSRYRFCIHIFLGKISLKAGFSNWNLCKIIDHLFKATSPAFKFLCDFSTPCSKKKLLLHYYCITVKTESII